MSLENRNIKSIKPLITPATLKTKIPVTEKAKQTILAGREAICDIIDGKDKRLLTVIGPCSIHDLDVAHDYAQRLKVLADDIAETHLVVMRIYFEKPRTTTGWKGLINDPHINDSFEVEEGLHLARQLLIDISEIGLPSATEALDPIVPQYLQDLISWSAIGARTTESQTHRELASGLTSPIGFKNATDGGLGVAINALKSVAAPHSFLGINTDGVVSVVNSTGNKHAHIVLRGGDKSPNYDQDSVDNVIRQLNNAKVNSAVMVDCSHANSNKDHILQPLVYNNVLSQRLAGNTNIIGTMVESHIGAGNQKIPENLSNLKYGISITDACIDWETTDKLLRNAHALLLKQG